MSNPAQTSPSLLDVRKRLDENDSKYPNKRIARRISTTDHIQVPGFQNQVPVSLLRGQEDSAHDWNHLGSNPDSIIKALLNENEQLRSRLVGENVLREKLEAEKQDRDKLSLDNDALRANLADDKKLKAQLKTNKELVQKLSQVVAHLEQKVEREKESREANSIWGASLQVQLLQERSHWYQERETLEQRLKTMSEDMSECLQLASEQEHQLKTELPPSYSSIASRTPDEHHYFRNYRREPNDVTSIEPPARTYASVRHRDLGSLTLFICGDSVREEFFNALAALQFDSMKFRTINWTLGVFEILRDCCHGLPSFSDASGLYVANTMLGLCTHVLGFESFWIGDMATWKAAHRRKLALLWHQLDQDVHGALLRALNHLPKPSSPTCPWCSEYCGLVESKVELAWRRARVAILANFSRAASISFNGMHERFLCNSRNWVEDSFEHERALLGRVTRRTCKKEVIDLTQEEADTDIEE